MPSVCKFNVLPLFIRKFFFTKNFTMRRLKKLEKRNDETNTKFCLNKEELKD